jgi:hypothetical protein
LQQDGKTVLVFKDQGVTQHNGISFAKLNSENIVITVESVVNEVLKDSNGVEQELLE